MNEVEEYVQTVVSCGKILRYSYQEVFEEKIDVNPHECSQTKFKRLRTLIWILGLKTSVLRVSRFGNVRGR